MSNQPNPPVIVTAKDFLQYFYDNSFIGQQAILSGGLSGDPDAGVNFNFNINDPNQDSILQMNGNIDTSDTSDISGAIISGGGLNSTANTGVNFIFSITNPNQNAILVSNGDIII